MRITFTDTMGVPEEYSPIPATRAVPDWYKAMPEYVSGRREIVDGATPHTMKKCIPVWDAMTAGYVIRTYVDVQVTQRDGLPYYEWPQHTAIGFHPVHQAPEYPGANGAPYPKWINPWSIRTPSGYSCLFVSPMHHGGPFKILSGVVDTDTYTAPVNFPFTLNDVGWTGLIPAGTPLAQVIPFRRDSWELRLGNEKDLRDQGRATSLLRSVWFNSYKRQFWTRKQYR